MAESLTGYPRRSFDEAITFVQDLGETAAQTLNKGVYQPDFRSSAGTLAVHTHILASIDHSAHAHINETALISLPPYARGRYLDDWRRTLGLPSNHARRAEGLIAMTGVAGAEIPVNTILQSTDNRRVRVMASVTSDGSGPVSVAVRAIDPGASGNMEIGTGLALVNPVTGFDPAGVVVAAPNGDGIAGGVDAEQDGDEWTRDLTTKRGRVLDRLENGKPIGKTADFRTWAFETPDVDVAFAHSLRNGMGPGTTLLYVLVEPTPDNPDGIPAGNPTSGIDMLTGAGNETGDFARVAAYVRSQAPDQVDLWLRAPIIQPLEIQASVNPDTATVRQQAIDAIRDLIRSHRRIGMTLRYSNISEAISGAAGESYHRLILPSGDVTAGDHAVFGEPTVTFGSNP